MGISPLSRGQNRHRSGGGGWRHEKLTPNKQIILLFWKLNTFVRLSVFVIHIFCQTTQLLAFVLCYCFVIGSLVLMALSFLLCRFILWYSITYLYYNWTISILTFILQVQYYNSIIPDLEYVIVYLQHETIFNFLIIWGFSQVFT